MRWIGLGLIFNVFSFPLCAGPSGEGKSTTVGLIERFYDPSNGEIFYLGSDVRSLNIGWYRSQLSFVGQEPALFNMSIAENIAFGLDGATLQDIEEAARQVSDSSGSYTARILCCSMCPTKAQCSVSNILLG